MSWEYKRTETEFAPIPEGDYRVRIVSADKAMSKNGRDMLVLQLETSGKGRILYHYITFLDDYPEITNRQLTQFFDSFDGIPDGDFNLKNWVGKVGACRVKHEESDYNGGTVQAKVHYFLSGKRKDALPAWVEPKEYDTPAPSDEFMPIPEGELPLF